MADLVATKSLSLCRAAGFDLNDCLTSVMVMLLGLLVFCPGHIFAWWYHG